MKQIICCVVFSSQFLVTLPAEGQRTQPLYEVARTAGSAITTEDAVSAATPPVRESADFGKTLVLSEPEPQRLTISGGAEATWLYTSNGLFTKTDRITDHYLSASAKIGARYALSPEWTADAEIRGGVFRFDKLSELDFQNLDFHCGLSLAPKGLPGVLFYSRYAFTELVARGGGDSFYTNHAAIIGGQSTVLLGGDHALTVGAAAQWAWADPSDAQRDDYSIYAAYRMPLTAKLNADLLYRLNYFVYRDSDDDRRDLRNSISLALRYEIMSGIIISAIGFVSHNDSNREGDYFVANSGATLSLDAEF